MNILDAFQNFGLTPKQKTATEWAASCPGCGGTKHCLIWPDHPTGTGGRYWCRECRKKGDLLDFLQEFEGLSYKAACEKAGKTKDSLAGREKRDNQRQSASKAIISFPARQEKQYLPPKQWAQQAATFLHDCQSQKALESEEAIERIACDRFLPPDHCRKVGIGWNNRDRWIEPSLWGLESPKKIWLPKGIVVATRRKDEVVSLVIRKEDNHEPRYLQAKGGAVDVPYIPRLEKNKPVFILESALDAALLAFYAGEMCTPVALGGTCKAIDADTMAFIQAAPLIVASPDNDDAGAKAWPHWKELFPSARLYRAIAAKDIGEMCRLAFTEEHKNDVPTVEQWAYFAICYAMKPINGA